LASLSLDLDNKWSYLKTHGDSGWESFPTYLDILVPRVLEFLKQRSLSITFMIVGQDAALRKNREPLSAIAEAGHEIGSHSFNHEPWLHLYSEPEIESELALAEEHIEAATGRRPIGFRGPGFSLSRATLRVLKRRGYHYDASTLPTFLGPLARAYYLMTAKLTDEERQRRKALFGALSDGLRPLKPYLWQLEAGELLEIPVTTMPLFRTPFHVSYLLYLCGYSPTMALTYFKMALNMCASTGTQVSLLLHPLDFLGGEDVPELSFFPGMSLPWQRKLELVARIMDVFCSRFNILTMDQHTQRCLTGTKLRVIEPQFRLPEAAPSPNGNRESVNSVVQ
jgi:peptidoglycan-N-acetylglucosamine deacetylase